MAKLPVTDSTGSPRQINYHGEADGSLTRTTRLDPSAEGLLQALGRQETLLLVLAAMQALATAQPLPTGAAAEATLAAVLTALQGLAKAGDTQPVSAASLPLPAGAATDAAVAAVLAELKDKADLTDTQPVSAAALPLPAGAATDAALAALLAAVTGTLTVRTADSSQDLRGLAATRPVATSVQPGTTFWAVDTDVVSVSNGATWRII